MLSIEPAPAGVGLGPHGHQAVGTSDDPFEQVCSLRSRRQGARSAAVAPHRVLNQVEDVFAYQRLVDPLTQLSAMPDHAVVKGVVQDVPYRRCGEELGTGDELPVGVGQALGIPCSEARGVEPRCQAPGGGRA